MVSVISVIDDLFDITSELEDVAVNWRVIGDYMILIWVLLLWEINQFMVVSQTC